MTKKMEKYEEILIILLRFEGTLSGGLRQLMYTVEDRKEKKNIVNYTDVTMIQDKKKTKI